MPRSVTNPMRNVLIDHIDGPVPIDTMSPRHKCVVAMVERGWLSYEHAGPDGMRGLPKARPRWSRITEAGRAVLARLLADYAEALIRAHYMAESPPPKEASETRNHPDVTGL